MKPCRPFVVSVLFTAIFAYRALGDEQPRAAIKPWAIPGPSESRLLLDPTWRGGALAALADRLKGIQFGIPWTQWRRSGLAPQDCETFSPRDEFDDFSGAGYYVFACHRPVEGGDWRTSTYFLREGTEPTVERVRWAFRPSPASDSVVVLLYNVLVDTLAARFGVSTDLNADSNDVLREHGPVQGRVFETAGDPLVVSVVRVPGLETVELVAVRMSKALRSELDVHLDLAIVGNSPGLEVNRPLATHREIAGALARVEPEMARALQSPDPSLEDLSSVEHGLASGLRRNEETADLVRLAAHHWLNMLTARIDSTGARDSLLHALERYGLRFDPNHYGTPWGGDYCGSLLEPLIRHAGRNRWADEGFVEWLEKGAHGGCDCQDGKARSVIEKGESFLSAHLASPSRAAVELLIAAAHETLWSGWKEGRSEDAGPVDLALAGPSHREKALIHYREALKRAPASWNTERLRRRILRLQIDVDTAQSYFSCGSE